MSVLAIVIILVLTIVVIVLALVVARSEAMLNSMTTMVSHRVDTILTLGGEVAVAKETAFEANCATIKLGGLHTRAMAEVIRLEGEVVTLEARLRAIHAR